MIGTKIILISAEISAILCAIILAWSIGLEETEPSVEKAFAESIFIIAAVGLQSVQQSISWK